MFIIFFGLFHFWIQYLRFLRIFTVFKKSSGIICLFFVCCKSLWVFCLQVYLCTNRCACFWCLKRSEWVIKSPGTVVTDFVSCHVGCGSWDLDLGLEQPVRALTTKHLQLSCWPPHASSSTFFIYFFWVVLDTFFMFRSSLLSCDIALLLYSFTQLEPGKGKAFRTVWCVFGPLLKSSIYNNSFAVI